MIDTLGAPELLIILVLVVVLFGAGKVGKIGKELGTSVKEFRRAVKDEDEAPAPDVSFLKGQAAPAVASPEPSPATTAAPDGPAPNNIF